MVDYGQDSILTVVLRQPRDQIHGYLLEWKCVWARRDSVHWRLFLVCHYFILLASGASLDVVCDPLAHPWPLLVLFGFADCFVSSGVSCCSVVVDQGHDGSFLFLCRGRSFGGHCLDKF
jgi:hypothetical protein